METVSGATVLVNGERISVKEWKKRQAKKSTKVEDRAVVRKEKAEPSLMSIEIAKMRGLCRPFTSLSGFPSRSLRSFGRVSEKVVSPIQREWYAYNHRYRELVELMDKIESTSQRKVKDLRDYSEQLAWKAEELGQAAMTLWKKYNAKKDWYLVNFGGQLIYEGRVRKGTEQMYDYGLKQLMLEKPQFTLENATAKLTDKARQIARVGAEQADARYN